MVANVPFEGMSRVGYMRAAAGEGCIKAVEGVWVFEQ